eukprot:s837_g15.t2
MSSSNQPLSPSEKLVLSNLLARARVMDEDPEAATPSSFDLIEEDLQGMNDASKRRMCEPAEGDGYRRTYVPDSSPEVLAHTARGKPICLPPGVDSLKSWGIIQFGKFMAKKGSVEVCYQEVFDSEREEDLRYVRWVKGQADSATGHLLDLAQYFLVRDAQKDPMGQMPVIPGTSADFVALRFDTSEYLFQTVKKPNLSMEEYFKLHVKQMQQPPQFELPQRLGICCGVWNPFDRCFQLSSYDLGLFPGFWQSKMPRRCGTQRVHARRFIHEKVKAKKGNRWEEYMSSTVVMVLKALREARCPLLVYDGLTDLIQLFDKFLGSVGNSAEECFDQWLQHFPAIYDVKWMALQDPPGDADVLVPPGLEKWRQEDPKKVTLAGLWRAIYCSPWTKRGRLPLRFREMGDRNFRAQSVLGLDRPTGIEGEGYMGRMTMMIAEIFVMLNDYRMPPMKKEDLKPSKVSRSASLVRKNCESIKKKVKGRVTKKQRRELTKKFADVGSTTLPDSADEVTSTPTFTMSASPTLKAAPVESRKRKFSEDDAVDAVPSPATPPEALAALALSELSELARAAEAAEPVAKRPRRPRCLTRVRQIESVVDAFARNLVNQRTEEDIDVTDAYGMELLERCASNCRFFRNVLCASGTPQGRVALDAQLVRGAVLEYENLEDL